MPYCGFKTSQGDFYAVTSAGQIIHFENGVDPGLHDAHERTLCLFVPPQAIKAFDDYRADPNHFMIAERDSDRLVCSSLVTHEPVIGSLPIKKRNNGRGDFTLQVGMPVTEIYRSRAELWLNAPHALMEAIERPARAKLAHIVALRPSVSRPLHF